MLPVFHNCSLLYLPHIVQYLKMAADLRTPQHRAAYLRSTPTHEYIAVPIDQSPYTHRTTMSVNPSLCTLLAAKAATGTTKPAAKRPVADPQTQKFTIPIRSSESVDELAGQQWSGEAPFLERFDRLLGAHQHSDMWVRIAHTAQLVPAHRFVFGAHDERLERALFDGAIGADDDVVLEAKRIDDRPVLVLTYPSIYCYAVSDDTCAQLIAVKTVYQKPEL